MGNSLLRLWSTLVSLCIKGADTLVTFIQTYFCSSLHCHSRRSVESDSYKSRKTGPPCCRFTDLQVKSTSYWQSVRRLARFLLVFFVCATTPRPRQVSQTSFPDMLRVMFVTILVFALSKMLTANPQSESPRMHDPNGPWKLVNRRKLRIHVQSSLFVVRTPVKLSMAL